MMSLSYSTFHGRFAVFDTVLHISFAAFANGKTAKFCKNIRYIYIRLRIQSRFEFDLHFFN